MSILRILLVLYFIIVFQVIFCEASMDKEFEELGRRYVDEFPGLSPVSATLLGDHRYDNELNHVTDESRSRQVSFYRRYLKEINGIDANDLSRANQIDHALLGHRLRAQLWQQEELQEWAWNPLNYTDLTGSSIYGLVARDFAPIEKRLSCVADRLEEFPRLFKQIRATLEPERVPKVHVETAIKQNPGVLSILDNMVNPHMDKLSRAERKRLEKAIEMGRHAVKEHQQWLESELLPNAGGEFRIGAELYDKKLELTLQTSLSRKELRVRAEEELHSTRAKMYEIAKDVYKEQNPYTVFPEQPTKSYMQAIIRSVLEMAYRQTPLRDEVVATAKESLKMTESFVREKDLVTIPPDPIDIIIMPEFRRGVSIAYCDSPGVLDVGQQTFYAIAPLPDGWTDEQVGSFLREYNLRSIHNLTIHEAMPGHFLQLAHSNRYPGKLRSVLSSGVFIEGWAVYTEHMMCEQGFLDNDPLMHLIVLKWYLRGISNAIIDQAIHVDGMSRDEAMQLMIEETFQEEREAAAKWTRAQLTSVQLSTYFVGFQEHLDMIRKIRQSWGQEFDLKKYHDKVLSFGSPPVKYVQALLLDEGIPR
jgi:uncharacterized protein (DUF885 family)